MKSLTKKFSHIIHTTNKRFILLNPYRHYGNVIDNEERSYNLNSSTHYTRQNIYCENFTKYYDTKYIDDSMRPHKYLTPIEELFSDDDYDDED